MGDFVGEAVLTLLADGRVRVDKADPYIHISLDLLAQMSPWSFDADGDNLTIGDINPVTYKLGEVFGDYVEAVLVP
jgi:hypothetical protein